jgi:hypothetical protein
LSLSPIAGRKKREGPSIRRVSSLPIYAGGPSD